MGKYLKKFDTHSEYENYINGGSGLFVPEIIRVSGDDYGETITEYNVPVYERGVVIPEITYKVYKPSFGLPNWGGVGVYWCSGYFSEDYHRPYLSGGMVSLDDLCAWNNGTYEDMGDYYIITLHNLTRYDDEWNSDDHNLWSLVWVYSGDIYTNELDDYTILEQYINWEASTEELILPNVSICADTLDHVYYNATKLPVFRILSVMPYGDRSLIVTNAGLGDQNNNMRDAIQYGIVDYVVGDNTVTVMEGNESLTFNIVDRTDDFVLCCFDDDIYSRYIFGIKEKTIFEFGGLSLVPGNSDVTNSLNSRALDGFGTVEEWISYNCNNDRPVTECKLIGKYRRDIVNEYDDLVLKYTSAGIDETEVREALDNEILYTNGGTTDNWNEYGICANAYAIDTLGNIWPLKTHVSG